MGSVVLKLIAKKGKDKIDLPENIKTFYDLSAKDIDGKEVQFTQF